MGGAPAGCLDSLDAMQTAAAERPLRWGIIGTGRIAHDFACALKASPTNELVAVAGRSRSQAQCMAALFGCRASSAHGRAAYAEVAHAADVDVVYVATFHLQHVEHALLCLRAGKHVLVEKPLAIDAPGARRIVAEARRRRRFVLEAHWTRFFPAVEEAARVVRSGEIGELTTVLSDFSYVDDLGSSRPEFTRALGGGATLMLGVYPLAACVHLFGAHSAVRALGQQHRNESGTIDAQVSAAIAFGPAQLGCAAWGYTGAGAEQTVLVCTRGSVLLHSPAHCPTGLSVRVAKGGRGEFEVRTHEYPLPPRWPGPAGAARPPSLHFPHSEGLAYELHAVEAAVRAGRLECEQMPHAHSVAIAELADSVRMQVGIVYPTDGLLFRARSLAWTRPRALAAAALAAAALVAVGAARAARRA